MPPSQHVLHLHKPTHPKDMASHKFPKFNLHIPSLHHSGSGTHPKSRCLSTRCQHQAHWTWRTFHATNHACPTVWETHRHPHIKNMQVLKLPVQASFKAVSWVFHHKTMRSMQILFFFTKVHLSFSSWVGTNGHKLRFPRGHTPPDLIKVKELDNEMLRLCQKLGLSKLTGSSHLLDWSAETGLEASRGNTKKWVIYHFHIYCDFCSYMVSFNWEHHV